MDVQIQNVIGTVRVVSGDSLLSPQTLQRVVSLVIAALDDRERMTRRARADTRILGTRGAGEPGE
ncbi:MAG TPA: hypothetical protein VII56_19170 [Rhizomicrobium sp.]